MINDMRGWNELIDNTSLAHGPSVAVYPREVVTNMTVRYRAMYTTGGNAHQRRKAKRAVGWRAS